MSNVITSPWTNRIKNANDYYNTWANRFRCETLENYYEGFQWRLANGQLPEGLGIRRPYTVNLVYATIRRKIANITYSYPEFYLDPIPGSMDWNQDFAVRSAQIKQAAINTVISNPRLEFVEDIRLAALDSFFRFAVIETGFGVDFRNPNKPKMYLKSHDNPELDDSKDRIISNEPPRAEETLYTKWISAKRFRVSMADDVKLRNCDWCGYYAFVPKEVLLNTPEFDLPKDLKDSYYSVDIADARAYFGDTSYSPTIIESMLKRGSLCKVWHIWDNVSGQRLLLLDGEFQELYAEPFERIPLETHRFDISLKGWYPIPPVFQWLSSQDEINESREQFRKYRRRSTRKFEVTKGDHDVDELEKLKTDEDGEVITTKRKDGTPSVRPIQNPDANFAMKDGLTQAKEDFDTIAAIPVSTGHYSDRQTATATKKLAADQAIVESSEQIDFSRFIAAIGREMLLQMGENLPYGLWVKFTLDEGPDVMSEIQANRDVYEFIASEQLNDGYDFTIRVSIKDATPAQMDAEKVKYIEFLSLVSAYPQVAMDADLIRETAYRCGYKNEKIIRKMQQMSLLLMMEKANAAQVSLASQGLQNGGSQSSNASAGRFAQQQPNSLSEIDSQLAGQVQA